MKRFSKSLVMIGLVLVIVALSPSVALMAPSAPVTYDSITVGCGTGNPNNPGQQRVAVSAQNVGGDGMAAFNLAFQLTGAEVVSAVAGSGWAAPAACSTTTAGFYTPGPGASANYVVTGSCTTPSSVPAVTGANVEIVVLTLSGPGGVPLTGPYNVALIAQDPNFFISTALVNPANQATNATANQLLAQCTPTAVTMSGFDAATESPAPFAAAAWPLLAGAAAVAAGGAYALLRRKS